MKTRKQSTHTNMNDQNPNPPPLPPSPPGFFNPSSNPMPIITLGSDATDRIPITGVVSAIEAILRQPRRVMYQVTQPNSGSLITGLIIIAVVCSVIYGVVVGTFSGAEQYWAAPVKITLGLMISALICVPSLYIFSCLGGSHARLVEVFGLLAGLLALMTILLIGFAPVAWVFSQSTNSVAMMGALHLLFWFVACVFGLKFIYAGFSHFRTRSFAGLQVWMVVFVLVALQMTTALRPIIGHGKTFLPPATEKKFFLTHWMDCLNQPQNGELTQSQGQR